MVSTVHEPEALRTVAARFDLTGEVAAVTPHGRGHIHATFKVALAGGRRQHVLLQRLNQRVFSDLTAVMDNVLRVTTHVRGKLLQVGTSDVARRVLHVIPTRAGESYLRDEDGQCYRAFEWIDGVSMTFGAGDAQLAFAAGQAFGAFQAQLADLPATTLATTIPGFHDTVARLRALRQAVRTDAVGRARATEVSRELDQIERHAARTDFMVADVHAGDLPLRIAHNDAKLDNLLFDAASGQALCVVDLDTVMQGYWLHDFGDLVRTLACPVAEDAPDLSDVQVDLSSFAALARGYTSALGALLSDVEWEVLPASGQLICFELAVRFLTDHLQGDCYFPAARPGHNLDRARVQLRSLQALQRSEPDLRKCLADLRGPG